MTPAAHAQKLGCIALGIAMACFGVLPEAGKCAQAASGPRGRRSPLAIFIPAEHWPRPPGGKEMENLIARLLDVRLSYRARAEAARGLAGATDKPAIQALAGALLERPHGPTKEYGILRCACADALSWAAAKGDKNAIRALWLVFEDRYHSKGWGRAAKALRDAVGGEEVMRLVGEALRGRRPFLKSDGKPLDPDTILRAWSGGGLGGLGACHFVRWNGGSKREVMRREIDRLITLIPGLTDKSFVYLLTGERGPALADWALMCRTRDQIPNVLARGLSNRGSEAREAFAHWICGVPAEAFYLHVRLDSRALEELNGVAESLEPETRKKIRSLIEKLCHGLADEVLSGKVSLGEACRSRIKVQAPSGEGPPRTIKEAEFFDLDLALQQLVFTQRIRSEDNPLLRILEARDIRGLDVQRVNGHIWKTDMLLMVASILYATPFPGAPGGNHLAKSAKNLIFIRVRELEANTLEGRRAIASLASAAAGLAPPEGRPSMIRHALAKLQKGGDVLWQAMFLYLVAGSVYSTPDTALPLDMAAAVVECLTKEASNPTPGRHAQILNLLRMTVEHMTPERLPGVEDDEAANLRINFGYPASDPPEPEPAVWRAWLERFKRLPVFRKN